MKNKELAQWVEDCSLSAVGAIRNGDMKEADKWLNLARQRFDAIRAGRRKRLGKEVPSTLNSIPDYCNENMIKKAEVSVL